MIIPLITALDTKGWQWRLVLDDAPGGHPLVDLQLWGDKTCSEWVHIKHVAANPAEVGVVRHSHGVLVLDDKKATERLTQEMSGQGATMVPLDGLTVIEVDPQLTLPEPDIPQHRRESLLGHLMNLEALSIEAMSRFPGVWRGQVRPGFVAVSEEDMNPEYGHFPVSAPAVVEYIAATQPLAVGALSRKIREAFFLMQDMARAIISLRKEIDNLSNPRNRPPAYVTRLDMFDRWLKGVQERVALFPTIQVPAAL